MLFEEHMKKEDNELPEYASIKRVKIIGYFRKQLPPLLNNLTLIE